VVEQSAPRMAVQLAVNFVWERSFSSKLPCHRKRVHDMQTDIYLQRALLNIID
jgi:hypothetical protein